MSVELIAVAVKLFGAVVKWVEVGYQPWGVNTLAHVIDEMVPGAFGELLTPQEMMFQRDHDSDTSVSDSNPVPESTS